MTKTQTITELSNILRTAFDASYLALLEGDEVSLDDELQQRLRFSIVDEVYDVLTEECERMGKKGAAVRAYFEEQASGEVDRRLKQELKGDQPIQASISRDGTPFVLLPQLERAEG